MSQRQALVIFGATGDLARRMLFPSLYHLEADGLLPERLAIVGCSRGSEEGFAGQVEEALRKRDGNTFSQGTWRKLQARLSHMPVDAAKPETFDDLRDGISDAVDATFHLSTSPDHFASICANLRMAGLAQGSNRIVVEKPIGRDLESCRAINDALAAGFREESIFRIDHYLGKESVQNLLALRFANTFFEPLWNKQSIAQVQITVAETIGVEDRWAYYDEYGQLRDMVQNHLLQLLCLVAMEPPSSLAQDSIRNEKVKVLHSLRPIQGRDLDRRTVRGQYGAGVAEGRAVPGYADEAGGRQSLTETFVALNASIDNWRWTGVPFYLRTGKRLAARRSQIVIQFRDVPHSIFNRDDLLANRLVIRLQPEEEISLQLMNKTPDIDRVRLKPLALNLSLSDVFAGPRRRIAYERLLLEALNNKPALFVRRDETEAAWSWIDAIASGWRRQSAPPASYPAGSWGPAGAFSLTGLNGHCWHE